MTSNSLLASIDTKMSINIRFDLKQMKAFVCVAQLLHFKRAADALFITQPALSRLIKALESELGANTYVGMGGSFDDQKATGLEKKASGSFFQHPVRLHEMNVGASLLFSFDTRDVTINPSRGQLRNIRYTRSTPA